MATTTRYSYDFENTIRDLSPVLSTVRSKIPRFISQFKDAPDATQVKHEWLEDQITGRSVTVTDVSTLTITASIADIAKLRVGTIMTIKDDSALFSVASIDSTTTATLTLVASQGSTTTAPSTDDVMLIVSTPEVQGSDAGTNSLWQSDVDYNYSQIFRFDVKLSRTALSINSYDVATSINTQTQYALEQLSRDINRQAIFGYRRNASSGVASMAGGLYEFGNQVGGLSVDASSTALDSFLINDAAQQINDAGGNADVIVCGIGQARVLSADMNDKIQVMRADTERGAFATQVVNDATGMMQTIFAEPDIPDTDCWVMDSSGLYVSTLQGGGLTDKDSTPKTFDGVQRSGITELTFEFKNAKQRVCKIKGLTASAAALAAKRSASVS